MIEHRVRRSISFVNTPRQRYVGLTMSELFVDILESMGSFVSYECYCTLDTRQKL